MNKEGILDKIRDIGESVLITAFILGGTYLTFKFFELISNLVFSVEYSWLRNESIDWTIICSIILIGVTYLLFSKIYKYILKILEKPLRISKKNTKKLENKYFMTTLFVSILLLFLGLSFYKLMYLSIFPIYSLSFDYRYNRTTIISECDSVKGYLYLVPSKDYLNCTLTLRNPSSDTYKGCNYMYFVEDAATGKPIQVWGDFSLGKEVLPPNSEKSFLVDPFSLPENITTGKDRTYYICVEWTYEVNGVKEKEIAYSNPYPALSIEDYTKKQYERFSVLLLVISVAIFSVSSTMKNIKDILSD